MKIKNKEWIRFAAYVAVVVLINLVASTLFFRMDLTQNQVYSLSKMSKDSVSSLEEPLTIRVFLSESLPQPYNNLSQEMRDLMDEYSLESNRNFNYELYELDKDGKKTDKNGTLLTTLAQKYGIEPVQIQSYDDNEVSLVSVYMGLVVMQGDLSQTINTLGFQSNLEYQITSTINDLAAKTNALIAMDNNINVKLVFSSLLTQLSSDYSDYSDQVKSVVDDLNIEYFDRLSYEYIDPTTSGNSEIQKYDLTTYNVGQRDGTTQKVYAALIVEKDDNYSTIDLIQRTILGDRIIGTDTLPDSIKSVADQLLGVQKTIGYLSDHGAPALYNNPYVPQQQQSGALGNFYQLLSQGYDVKPVTLNELPKGLDTLIIAGVSEEFSDWELYQLDQFLLHGGSLLIFLDPFKEEAPQGQMAYFGGQPTYTPIDTGLEKLLAFHGINVKQSYLMDKEGYVQRSQNRNGGYEEIELPFAPLIDQANIDTGFSIMRTVKKLVMLDIAPLDIQDKDGLDSHILFQSSPEAWEMSDNISLVPQTIYPPSEDKLKQYPLSAIVDGHFDSYFRGHDLPEPPKAEAEEGADDIVLKDTSAVLDPVTEGDGKIFVIGSSKVLGDNILDAQGQTPNSLFIQNVVDYMAGNEDLAIMRSKGMAFNPQKGDLSSGIKTFIQTFNIAILPALVILAGLIVWVYWMKRKKKIQQQFMGVVKK
ncbi:Gldg family protein [Spirochaeta cellobiosiphila]|uniref:Gldg family protein n=1 Tax=Spirochaeta cellobiosiphila TaxID=504483 RepID=UPI0003FBD449|nr:Gldg family protein [Spirochaeta cellobiosiphila]